MSHPETEGVSLFLGTILMDGNDDNLEEITDTVCVFAEREVGGGNFRIPFRNHEIFSKFQN